MFMRMENRDDYLGPFPTLKQCERGAEIRLDILNKMNGAKKAVFFCKDDKGKHRAGWVLGVEEDW